MKKIKFNDKFEIEDGLDEQIKAFKESQFKYISCYSLTRRIRELGLFIV